MSITPLEFAFWSHFDLNLSADVVTAPVHPSVGGTFSLQLPSEYHGNFSIRFHNCLREGKIECAMQQRESCAEVTTENRANGMIWDRLSLDARDFGAGSRRDTNVQQRLDERRTHCFSRTNRERSDRFSSQQ